MDGMTKWRRKSLFREPWELGSARGEVEKCHDGIFQRTASERQWGANVAVPVESLEGDCARPVVPGLHFSRSMAHDILSSARPHHPQYRADSFA
jgi:hypothetical protein